MLRSIIQQSPPGNSYRGVPFESQSVRVNQNIILTNTIKNPAARPPSDDALSHLSKQPCVFLAKTFPLVCQIANRIQC